MAALGSTLTLKTPQSGIGIGLPGVCGKRSSLLFAISQTVASRTQQGVQNLVSESVKNFDSSVKRVSQAKNLEEAFMTVPDLETVPYRVVSQHKDYEIRQLESYLVAETKLPGRRGFEFVGSSQAFNAIAGYIFGKNARKEEMKMTTPVIVKGESTKLDMTMPVVSSEEAGGGWKMAFVMPSKYDEATLPVPEDSSVTIRRVPPALKAVSSFSGFVTDEIVRKREKQLRKSLENNPTVRVKADAKVEVAQYNPPFTPPLFRRNEVALEVEEVLIE